MCRAAEPSGLPRAVGPHSDRVRLTNEMSHREDGATKAPKRSSQTNSNPAFGLSKTAPNLREEARRGLPTDHSVSTVHFSAKHLADLRVTVSPSLAKAMYCLSSRDAGLALAPSTRAAGLRSLSHMWMQASR